jgi:CDGSH-type Zn-finger protein
MKEEGEALVSRCGEKEAEPQCNGTWTANHFGGKKHQTE